jgi:hypothetical protein
MEASAAASQQNEAEEALLRAHMQRLAAADVVLVSYPVLSREVRALSMC